MSHTYDLGIRRKSADMVSPGAREVASPAARSTQATGSGGRSREVTPNHRLGANATGHDFSRIPVHAADGATVPRILHEVVASAGRPLDQTARTDMEWRFGLDFDRVRIHDDALAGQAARAAGARAYTAGEDIVFGPGYSPGSSAGSRLLAHELGHVVQQRIGMVQWGAVQRDEIEVTLVEVSQAESDLLFSDLGIRLPGSPPRVTFGADGPIPTGDQKAVQQAFDLAYSTAASPTFAVRFGEFKQRMGKAGGSANMPGLADLSQQKYLEALARMTIHLADSTKNPLVQKWVREESESGEKLPIAGFTPIGGNSVYLRGFAIRESRDALASLILHESVHVAGLPNKPINEFLETILEVSIHGFEASVGLPLSQIVEKAASISDVKPRGAGVEFTASVTKAEDLPSDTISVEILDGNRHRVFVRELPKGRFSKPFVWNGLAAGKPTESGIHSIRVVAGNVLIAARDYVLRR
jgi:hypothetical protein